MHLISRAQHDALVDALPTVCQFLELIADHHEEAQEAALIDMDCSDDAFAEAVAALHSIIGYKPGERPDDEGGEE